MLRIHDIWVDLAPVSFEVASNVALFARTRSIANQDQQGFYQAQQFEQLTKIELALEGSFGPATAVTEDADMPARLIGAVLVDQSFSEYGESMRIRVSTTDSDAPIAEVTHLAVAALRQHGLGNDLFEIVDQRRKPLTNALPSTAGTLQYH